MAPALPDAARADTRRAFTAVDNVPPMEDGKDAADMDQILVELGGGETDLLQAIKTLETAPDMFPLSGFELPEQDADSDGVEERVRGAQARLERRCAVLRRRLRILQARDLGKRAADEAAKTVDTALRAVRKDGSGRALGLKTFLKKVETAAALQGNAAARSMVGPSYYRGESVLAGDATRSAALGIPAGSLAGLQDTAGALRSHLAVVKRELDSDDTASSSGAESNDEPVIYNNQHQNHMPIEKRALWSWQRSRASIAARWSWLQTQVQELEYKIRQHTDLQAQVREAKGPVEFEGAPAGYEGPLPGDDVSGETCARVRALRRETFKKRKLLQMHNLHVATEKAAKPADIRCGCDWPTESCAVCTGRAVSTQPTPAAGTLTPRQRLALLDPGYHPVLSDIRDVSPSIHLAALSSCAWFRSRSGKSSRGAHHSHASSAPATHASAHATAHASMYTPTPKVVARKPTGRKRGRPPLTKRCERRPDEQADTSTKHDFETPPVQRSRGRPSTESRVSRVVADYDIDNIVIPPSVAANNRPEIPHFKEIMTPKWRIVDDITKVSLNNGSMNHRRPTDGADPSDPESSDSDGDISEEQMAAWHAVEEQLERSRFVRKQRGRRPNSTATTATVDGQKQLPPPPPPPLPPQPQPVEEGYDADTEVRPYTPRKFPLSEQEYMEMCADCGAGTSPLRLPSPPPLLVEPVDGDDSVPSPMSPTFFDDGDDPADAEWEPTREKIKRTHHFK